VFLSGGPGGALVRFTRGFAEGRLFPAIRAERDIVLWDQRGTGYSEPTLCPDLAGRLVGVDLLPGTAERRIGAAVEVVAECRRRMEAENLDFSAYNSATSARDLDDLRRALGYEPWNVFGASYGTRLALTAARDVPGGIRALVLDAVSPTTVGGGDYEAANLAGSLDRVFRQCEADSACRLEFPNLEAEFDAIVAVLDAVPLRVAVSEATVFSNGEVVLDGRTFALGLFRGLYSEDFIPLVPMVMRELKARNTHLLASLAEALAPDPETENPWLYYLVECYEQAPLLSPTVAVEMASRHPRHALISDPTFGPICETWHGERADTALLRRPIAADIPALVAAGEFDPVTPPAYGRLVAEHLPQSQYFEVRGMGHGTLPFTACTRELTLAFLDDPDRPLDTGCLDALPGVSFVTDVHVTPGVGRLARRLTSERSLAWSLWAGATVLVLLWAVVGWPVVRLVRRARRGTGSPGVAGGRVAWPVAWLASLAALGFAVSIGLVIRAVAASNPFVLALGIPGPAAPVLWIPWGVLVLTGGALPFAVLAWRRGWWTESRRIGYGLVSTACVSFLVLVANLGLFMS
jgi:pimeloyl-ACP methyl ester carboxylesterase